MTEARTIDVTGLPEPVVAGLQGLVANLRAALPAGNGPAAGLSPEERVRRFTDWVNRPLPPAPPFVDDSRESIYEGRGE